MKEVAEVEDLAASVIADKCQGLFIKGSALSGDGAVDAEHLHGEGAACAEGECGDGIEDGGDAHFSGARDDGLNAGVL